MLDAPEVFRTAVAGLQALRPRPEIALTPTRPPQRLAPYSHAIAARLDAGEQELVTARLILLHDPDGQQAWDGTLRLVCYVRAEVEADIAADPMLPAVGWSWLTEALEPVAPDVTALGGTVTLTSSARFGDIAGPERTDDVELRASWTPRSGNLRPHGAAFCDLLGTAAGLPPTGVSALEPFLAQPAPGSSR